MQDLEISSGHTGWVTRVAAQRSHAYKWYATHAQYRTKAACEKSIDFLRAKDEYENLCLAAVRTNLTPKPFSVEVRRLRKGRWHPVIVMELIEGETLLCYNKSEKEKRAIGEKLDKKLRERGIFHPDLAARNIMWDKKKRMWRVVDLENVAFSYLEET